MGWTNIYWLPHRGELRRGGFFCDTKEEALASADRALSHGLVHFSVIETKERPTEPPLVDGLAEAPLYRAWKKVYGLD